jgi:hypothetical protein
MTDAVVLLTPLFTLLAVLSTFNSIWCRRLCTLTLVVVVITSSVFDIAVLVDALGSGVNRCASMYGAAIICT